MKSKTNPPSPSELNRKEWRTVVQWPKGTIGTDGDQSEDTHYTKEEAEGVKYLLHKNGFGGDGKIFPISVYIGVNPNGR